MAILTIAVGVCQSRRVTSTTYPRGSTLFEPSDGAFLALSSDSFHRRALKSTKPTFVPFG